MSRPSDPVSNPLPAGDAGVTRLAIRRFLADAPRQPRADEAWHRLSGALADALRSLQEDEWLVLSAKDSRRFVQCMCQGSAGFRAESVSDFYLPDGAHLSAADRERLLALGWEAPTRLPDAFGHDPDGSPNYFLDLAPPVPLDELAQLLVVTLVGIHGVEHPGGLEYATGGPQGRDIRLPQLGLRREGEGR